MASYRPNTQLIIDAINGVSGFKYVGELQRGDLRTIHFKRNHYHVTVLVSPVTCVVEIPNNRMPRPSRHTFILALGEKKFCEFLKRARGYISEVK